MDGNELSIQEFIQIPTTIDLIVPYTPLLEQVIAEKPHVKLGKIMGSMAVIYATLEDVQELSILLSLNFILTHPLPCGLLGDVDLESIGAFEAQDNPEWGYTGEGVLLGFVDTGIDYTNEAFRHSNGDTRIKYIWDQSIDGSSPDSYFFGSEYTEEDLNRALKNSNPTTIVPHEDTVGHGTFLSSVAGGGIETQSLGVATRAEFIVVKLKDASQPMRDLHFVPEYRKNVYSSIDVQLGIQYLIEKAEELNKPISICLGVGTNIGGHDGTMILEKYIDTISKKTGVCISSAAGNESQAKHHTSGRFTEEKEKINMDIKVEEESGSFMNLIVSGPSDRMSVSIVSPIGEVISRVPPKPITRLETKLTLERTTILIEYIFPLEITGAQLTAIHFINPTPGTWRVILQSDILVEGQYNAWLPITPLGPVGLEFVNPDPNVTIVVPSTTIGVICCGAYNSEDNSLYINSSWGPTRLSLSTPDLAAPGVDVIGMYPSGLGTMSGTSVASAMTAGSAALLLQWGITNRNDPFLNTNKIKFFLIRGCSRDSHLQYPNYQWGYGRLNIYQTFLLLKENN